MVQDDESRVRQKAHELWEAEGRPDGRAARHWEEAREIVALTDSFGSTLRPLDETLDEPVEPVLAYQNQGDVPEMTDLGEGARGPSWAVARETAGLEASGDADAPASEAAIAQAVRARGQQS